jgi:hypothetical protein
MTKRSTLQLGALAAPPEAEAEPVREELVTVYARVPYSLAEKIKDIARERSKAQRRRVPVNDIVVEALRKMAF